MRLQHTSQRAHIHETYRVHTSRSDLHKHMAVRSTHATDCAALMLHELTCKRHGDSFSHANFTKHHRVLACVRTQAPHVHKQQYTLVLWLAGTSPHILARITCLHAQGFACLTLISHLLHRCHDGLHF